MRASVITSPDEIAEHEAGWEALRRECHGTVFSSPLAVRAWLEAYDSACRPQVVLVEDDGGLVGVAPLIVHRLSVGGLPIRVLTLAGEVSHKLWLMTNSFLWPVGRKEVLEAMVEEMSKMRWDLFTAAHMEDNRAAGDLGEAVISRWQDEGRSSGISISVPIPEKGGIIDLFSKNARKNVRQSLRDLEREGLDLSFREVPPAEAGRFVDTYIQQHIGRWASKGGSIFERPEHVRFLRTVVERACANGQGFAHELLIDDQVAAQNFGFLDGDIAYSYRTGMNEAFAPRSPGWLIKVHGMGALRERGVKSLVLGLGAEDHKYRMGGAETRLVGVRVSRGMLSAVTRVARSRPAQYLGSRLNIAGRLGGQGSGDEQ